MYMYLYKCVAFTEAKMIKRMSLIQIYLTSYLILLLSSLYILHTTVSNSTSITIKDIFICSALRMFVVRLPCSRASPKTVSKHCPFTAATSPISLDVVGGYRANFHLGPKFYPNPVGTRWSLRSFQPKTVDDSIILYLAVIVFPRKWGQCWWTNSTQSILRFEILCSNGGLTHAKEFYWNTWSMYMYVCMYVWGISALLRT